MVVCASGFVLDLLFGCFVVVNFALDLRFALLMLFDVALWLGFLWVWVDLLKAVFGLAFFSSLLWRLVCYIGWLICVRLCRLVVYCLVSDCWILLLCLIWITLARC